MRFPKDKFFTSCKTGITMRYLSWLQVIADKEFGFELCMKAMSTWKPVIERFNEYLNSGIIAATERSK